MSAFFLGLVNTYAWYFMAVYFRGVALTHADRPTPRVDFLCNVMASAAAVICIINFALTVQGSL